MTLQSENTSEGIFPQSAKLEPLALWNHPVCARLRWLRVFFLMGAATPPNLGGELGSLFPLLSLIFGAGAGLVVSRIAGGRKTASLLTTLASGILIAALSIKFRRPDSLFLVYAGLVLLLAGATVFDIRKHEIPLIVTIPGTIAGLIFGSFALPLGIRESALGLLIGGGVLLIATAVEALRKKEIGGGDWKYAAMIGSFIGPQRIVIALVLTGVFGVLGAIILALLGSHAKPQALGPWLSAGAVASIFLG